MLGLFGAVVIGVSVKAAPYERPCLTPLEGAASVLSPL